VDRTLRVLAFHSGLELLVPALIIEEFDRNRLRSESAVTTSVFLAEQRQAPSKIRSLSISGTPATAEFR
jgi:hypothetical protein